MIDNVSVTTYVVEDLAPATWFFAVTAVNSVGTESAYSNVANKEIDPRGGRFPQGDARGLVIADDAHARVLRRQRLLQRLDEAARPRGDVVAPENLHHRGVTLATLL